MRVSLLLEREPFGPILEKTLSRFWSEEQNHPISVEWRMGRPVFAKSHPAPHEQLWLANIYLNAIFSSNAETDIFEPIRREFGRSPRWWLTPFQRMYTELAFNPKCAPYMAQASLKVSPPVSDSKYKLVVAGNHKIRILDRRNGLAYGILKDAFRPDFMRNEIEARRLAARLDMPVPALIDVASDQTWFSEKYVVGTPINRLSDKKMVLFAVEKASKTMMSLITATKREESLEAYTQRIWARADALLGRTALLRVERSRILGLLERLIGQITNLDFDRNMLITTSLTHGDFQPANILLNEQGIWLIDWEYSARRQAGYDALVLALSARFPRGLAERLSSFVNKRDVGYLTSDLLGWPGLKLEGKQERSLHALLFLAEDLLLHVEEHAQPAISKLNRGFGILLSEIARWVEEPVADGC